MHSNFKYLVHNQVRAKLNIINICIHNFHAQMSVIIQMSPRIDKLLSPSELRRSQNRSHQG